MLTADPAALRAAVALEDTLLYDEPPDWIQPVRHALGAALVAAGGTLGILIPPSVILVLYALMTEQSIAKMFVAAMIPGVIAAVGYMIAVAVFVRLRPDAGPAARTRATIARSTSWTRAPCASASASSCSLAATASASAAGPASSKAAASASVARGDTPPR